MKNLRGVLGPWPMFPLGVMLLINFFDQFDTAAFSVLAPEIKEHFGLSTAALAGIAAMGLLLPTAFVLVIGYYADRLERKPFVVYSAIVAAATSFLTGAAGAVWILVVLRLVNGVGRMVNEPVHTSLLSDYYPPEVRPKVFSVHRSGEQLGQIAAPTVVGAIAGWIAWQWTFFIVAVPALAAGFIAFRLREPDRGTTEDAEAAAKASKEPPIPFARAFRMLYHVRTLRRIWLAQFFAGAGLFPLFPVFTLYWEKEFSVGVRGRGYIGTLGALAGLFGIIFGGVVSARLLKKGPHLVQLLAGLVLAVNSALLLVVAAAPTLWLGLSAFFVISFGFGVHTPSALAVASIVIPPRVRSQGFSFSPLFLSLGGILAAPLGGIADEYGYRWALSTFAPVLIVAGLTFASAFLFVAGDQRRAIKTLETEAMLREQRLSAKTQSLLVCRGVDVSYDLLQVLHEVDLEVKEGEIVALLGTNGAGKSTLLRTIAGLKHPDAGVIFFDGENATFYEPEESTRAGIVLSPGGQSPFGSLTVEECLLTAAWSSRRNPDEVRRKVRSVLDLFPRLEERLPQTAGTLSGGEQQMLVLAQAVMHEPRLLMIDELTLGLSPKVVAELLEAVRRIHASGVSVLLVEQSVNVALSLAQRAYFMERGRIRFEGPTADLLGRDDLLRPVFLGAEAAKS